MKGINVNIDIDNVDVEAIKGQTRIFCPWGTPKVWIGIHTHRLNGLVQSSIFSPPAHIYQMQAYGSVGRHSSIYESWGDSVGSVRKETEVRSHFHKRFNIAVESPMRIRELRGRFHSEGVKNPVVHYIYIRRGNPPLYMLWGYSHSFKEYYAISRQVERELRELASDHFEAHITFDLYAVSDIKLGDEDLELAVINAHSWTYIYENVRRVLASAHGTPTAFARLEYPIAPKVVSDVKPMTAWTYNTY